MRSILFCTSYFRDAAEWSGRYVRWANYYRRFNFGACGIFLIDDGSPFDINEPGILVRSSQECINQACDKVQLVRFNNRLGRSAPLVYPGWWRSFTHSLKIARSLGADKIIHLESDAFVLSRRLMDFIEKLDSGWTVMWTDRYKMPETAIQIICADQFDALDAFADGRWRAYEGVCAEQVLPFTDVVKNFVGERYSEIKRNRWIFRSRKFDRFPIFQNKFFLHPIPSDADFATQVTDRQWVTSAALKRMRAS